MFCLPIFCSGFFWVDGEEMGQSFFFGIFLELGREIEAVCVIFFGRKGKLFLNRMLIL